MILRSPSRFWLGFAGFAVVLWWVRIVPVSRDALKVAMAGLGAMTDSELDDASKEVAVRRAGLASIGAAFNIFWRFVLALAAAAAPIFLADAIGLVPRDAVFGLMLRWDYIIIVSVVAIALSEIVRRRRALAGETISKVNRYSAADRFFHMLAFSNPAVLKAAFSSIEDQLISWAPREPSAPPVFITSLARGGTTALLNALHDIPGIATHTYRDMPFLTAPILWNRLAGGRKRGVELHERAHGDGLEIDLDTPEAFEEVIWKMFWPEKFQGGSIGLWGVVGDRKAEAEQFLAHHMAKVIRAREFPGRDAAAGMVRYCSKNNTNVARIPYLVNAFPGCRIIVPVRRPESHAASLLRQHKNFLNLQAEDGFVSVYARYRTFQFGALHKPLQFPGFEEDRYDPVTGDYWLHYWTQAFHENFEAPR